MDDVRKENKKLRKALKNLVKKVEKIQNSSHFSGVFTMASIHGYSYQGDTWDKELDKAKKLLERIDHEI